MRYEELTIEGRNAVLEAFRSGKTIDKLFVLVMACGRHLVQSLLCGKAHDRRLLFSSRSIVCTGPPDL